MLQAVKSIMLTKLWWNLQKDCSAAALLIYNSSCRIKHFEKHKCCKRKRHTANIDLFDLQLAKRFLF